MIAFQIEDKIRTSYWRATQESFSALPGETVQGKSVEIKEYRFVSLFNSCKGLWRETEEEANKDGELHEELLWKSFNPNSITI